MEALQKENLIVSMVLASIATTIIFGLCVVLALLTNQSITISLTPCLLTFAFVGMIMYLKVSGEELKEISS